MMNERIRELYEQARLHAKSIDADIDPKGWMDLYHQKFAELIEQDCIDKFIKVWYEQGLDIRGADLNKFMLRVAELSNEKVS